MIIFILAAAERSVYNRQKGGVIHMKKRLIPILLALLILLSLCSCSSGDSSSSVTVPVIDAMKQFELPDNEALRFVRSMKTGWNLGNTFDAWNNGGWFNGQEPEMETYWCRAKTTRELISALHAAGFQSIRVPVSWHDHVDSFYNVNPIWMNRVKEVVQWALDEGMYVIVNVHHDNDPAYFYPDSAHYDQSARYLTAIWSAMAAAFADCDEHLILESMNEPRLTDTVYEWNFSESSPECRDAAECINKLNQLFVDTVRATGGRNATRYLAVPGYTASCTGVLSQYFKIPDDTADNRIILSVHAYTPYNFALNMKSGSFREFDIDNDTNQVKKDIAGFMNELYYKYVAEGIPVMIDEYGALNKSGNLQDRVNFAAYYTCAASARGMTCFWWDNHAFSGNGELFGLIDRKTCEWKFPEIVDAIMANCMFNRE